ncbi:MAG TPA: pitrilysin family protein [Stellaceae bacterium]|nr:pitrilysin family protein [Stellaceae bacterium]
MRAGARRYTLVAAAFLFVLLLRALPAAAVTVTPVKSAGGVEAWLVEDHSLPLIAIKFAFGNGAGLDPPGKEGLAYFTTGLLDEGAGDLDSEAYKARLEDLSIRLSFNADVDATSGSMRMLAANADAAFDLLHLALTRPRFDADAIERVRAELVSELQDAAQDPGTIGSRIFWRTAFPGQPYGRRTRGTQATVAKIDAADMRRFVAEHFGRDRLKIGVVGDVTPEKLRELLDRTFGDLPARSAPDIIPETAAVDAGAYFLVKVPVPQSVVIFGERGLKRDDPDWYAALLLNEILGGSGLNSRLSAAVRDKRGLAYSVYSDLYAMRHAGMIVGRVATRNDRVGEAIDVIRAEWQRMGEEGPSEAELAAAKSYSIGSFASGFDSTEKLAALLVSLQVENLGIDYMTRRAELLQSVTIEDVRRVARRVLDAHKLRVVVVGDPPTLLGAHEVPPDGG